VKELVHEAIQGYILALLQPIFDTIDQIEKREKRLIS